MHQTSLSDQYNFSRADFPLLHQKLSEATLVPAHAGINIMVRHWTNFINSVVEATIPKAQVRPSSNTPWIDGEVKHASHIKET